VIAAALGVDLRDSVVEISFSLAGFLTWLASTWGTWIRASRRGRSRTSSARSGF
jgi:hypothetical protein